jgi:hypothetical protein
MRAEGWETGFTRARRTLIRDFRRLYFGGSNLTKRRCEEFFDDEDNFTKYWSMLDVGRRDHSPLPGMTGVRYPPRLSQKQGKK